VLTGRVNEVTPSTSRWRRIYLAVAIYTVLAIVLLYVFSSYFGG
jgi:anti-sigma-K factor RskA